MRFAQCLAAAVATDPRYSGVLADGAERATAERAGDAERDRNGAASVPVYERRSHRDWIDIEWARSAADDWD